MNLAKVYTTIDTHVLGENFRIVTQSPMRLPSLDVNENQTYLGKNFTIEKKLILNEPRGHRGINGCLIAPSAKADYQLLSFNHEGANSFKYESLFASLTALLETGNLEASPDHKYQIETSEGIYELKADIADDQVTSISINGIKAQVLDEAEGFYKVSIDGKRSYYLYPLDETVDTLHIKHLADLTQWSEEKIASLIESKEDFEGVIIKEKLEGKNRYRTVSFEKDGYIRRSPSIDVSIALLAILEKSNGSLYNETIFSSSLSVEYDQSKQIYAAKLRPFITGTHQFLYDKDDPLYEGFILK